MGNIKIETYIIKDKASIIKDVGDIDTNLFISIKNIKEINPKEIDVDYIDGAILLSVNNKVIMDFTFWDDVQALWHYFLNAFEEILEKGEAKFTFPSQNLPVSLKVENNNRLLLKIEGNKLNIEAKKIFENMCIEAILFFNALKRSNRQKSGCF